MKPLIPFLLPLLSLLALPACGSKQYVAIPGASLLSMDENLPPPTSTQAPTLTVVTGSPNLTVGQSVTLNVDFSTVTDYQVTEIVVFMVEMEEEWQYELSDDEEAAGAAQIEVEAVAEKPAEDTCYIPYHQHGWCAQEAESGVTDGVMWAIGANDSSAGVRLPITLPAADAGGDACSSFTESDCCSTSGGVQSVSCHVSDCGCPSGTTDGGVQGDGTTLCLCPG